jgi:hypothetical protein
MGPDKTASEKENLKEGERLVAGAMNVLQNAAADNDKEPDFILKVMHSGGKAA